MRLKDKRVIVTGGLRGLGRTLTRRFLDEGAYVVCAARAAHRLEELAAAYGDRIHFEQVDVADLASVERMVDRAVDRVGIPDALITNAGIHADGLIHRADPAGWSDTLNVNVNGAFHCVRTVAPLMTARGAGRIVTVSSIMGSRPTVGAGAYCVSKAAIEMLTRVCALELGAKGVLVNCVAPGFLDVGMGTRLSDNEKAWGGYRRTLALRRMGEPDEVASAAVFLVGPESSYINGQVLEVSGGIRWA